MPIFNPNTHAICGKCNGKGCIYDGAVTSHAERCNLCLGAGTLRIIPNQEEPKLVVNHKEGKG